jgi:L-lysine 2,3-aminomutase
MIQQANVSVESHWQKELKESFSRPKDLLEFLGLSDHLQSSQFEKDNDARQLFAMRVPKHFAKLMKPNDRNDPLLKQVLPSHKEFVDVDGFTADPLDEHEAELPGLLHKYRSRVLIMFRTGCAVNCRYCFRRHFPYEDNSVNKQQLNEHLSYLQAHPEINEVILSGGDPLMAKDESLAWFIEQLDAIKSVTRLRIHTRLPVVIPSRITNDLCELLNKSRLNAVVVLHINHPNEVSDALRAGVKKLKQADVTVLNQAVLLSGINNEVATQVQLSETLFSAGILPYYLHLFDKVSGASHFDSCEKNALKIYRQMLKELPGFLVPKMVREIGGEASKTPIELCRSHEIS